MHCVTCDREFNDDDVEQAALSPLQCQTCWEAQCSQSWWEMVTDVNTMAHANRE